MTKESENKLPPGWTHTTLGEAGKWGSGGTPKRTNPVYYDGGKIPWLVIGDLNDGFVNSASTHITEEGLANSSAKLLPKDTVLIAMYGSIGKLGMTGIECTTNQAIAYCKPHSGVDRWFLFHSLRSSRDDLIHQGKGGAQQNISQTVLKAFPSLLPPLNEQRRIVARVDALQSRSRRAREALDAIPALLDRFRQSVLAAAFRGDLTADWRAKNPDVEPASVLLERIRAERKVRWIEAAAEKARARAEAKASKAGKPWTADDDANVLAKEKVKAERKYKEPPRPDLSQEQGELPDGWCWASVAELAECLDSIRRPITRKDRLPGPFPYYGANGQVDAVADYLFDEELVLVTEDETFYGRTKPIAYRVSGKCWVNNHAHVLRALAPVTADYLCYRLMHFHVIPWLSGTTGRAKLTQGAMKALPVPLAPAGEMTAIANAVTMALSKENMLRSPAEAASSMLDTLDQSILAKAFRGELVPQDPTDEPASVLLTRIKAERAAQAAKAPKKRRGRRKGS